MTESRADMLARHARELAELEKELWWEEWATESPWDSWARNPDKYTQLHKWMKEVLPTIIRKREKIGVAVYRDRHWPDYIQVKWIDKNGIPHNLHGPSVEELLEHIAGRTLAPGEKVEI